jgi:hypothetical protein
LRLNLWRCLCSVVPNTPLVYLRWEGNEKGYAVLKGRRLCLLPQSAPPRTAFVCEARDRRVGLLPVWEQGVYLMLDREGQAVIATQRYCVHIPRYVDRIRPARAALTSGLARNAPRTSMESIVSSASSGGTSSATLARPSTLISSVSPASRTASRSGRV